MSRFRRFLSSHKIVIFISLILSIIPFFWLKPGEMDLGGDSSRLYFYDPLSLLKNVSLYTINPEGIGNIESNNFNIPFLVLTLIIKLILHSSYLVISFFNVLKLVVGFLAMYAIIKELLEVKGYYHKSLCELSAIMGGLFYIFSPMFIGNFDRALNNHDQIFLNPLIFYLLLRFFLTRNLFYAWALLMISFVFSTNFSWVSAPPFFAFYPLGIVFLILYAAVIRRKKLPWRGILAGFVVFFGLHSFHLIPNVTALFEQGSSLNNQVFSVANNSSQLDYFYGVLPIAKVSTNILSYSELKQFGNLSIIYPFIIILGLLLHRKKQNTIVLTSFFFLITFFLISANITNLGVKFYSMLFYIPGFIMFRNFIGQWQFVFYFFYALLFGQAMFVVFSLLKKRYVVIFSLTIGIILTITAWPFINGSLVNKVHFQSNGVKYAIIIDPQYEETLSYIKSLPDDAKILTLPFTDCCYQVIHGTNNGAYIGLSTISYLGGKKDYSGYVKIAPFSDIFLKLAKGKDYASIKRMLSLLNVKYIFYNKDPLVYDTTFPSYPYQYVRTFLPSNQKDYREFVNRLTDGKIFERGPYSVYTLDKNAYLPHFYIATDLVPYTNTVNDWYGKTVSFFVGNTSKQTRVLYVEREACNGVLSKKACSQKFAYDTRMIPRIHFEKVNPVKYKLKVFGAKKGYTLVFSEAFHRNWKVYLTNSQPQESKSIQRYYNGDVEEGIHENIFLNGKTFETLKMRSLAENRHIMVNGFANAWHITPQDVGGKTDYEFIVEMTGQRIFYLGLAVSLFTFVACVIWGIWLLLRVKHR